MTDIKPEDIEVLSDHCDGYGGPALLFHNIPVQNRTITEIESDLEKTKQQILQALKLQKKINDRFFRLALLKLATEIMIRPKDLSVEEALFLMDQKIPELINQETYE